MKKKISVCMATYNGEKYIQEQIESILNQLDETDELVISDDGSTDKTLEIIKNFHDKRINLIHNTEEHGYTKNFENALKNATGDIFFLSDQDDFWLPDKVIRCLEYLEHYNFVMTDAFITNDKLVKEKITHFEKYNVTNGFWKNFTKTRYVGALMAFDRTVYNQILPFPNKQFYCPHDYWIVLVVESGLKSKLIREPLVLYRRHESVQTGKRRSISLIIKTRIYSLFALVKRKARLR